VLLNDAFRNFDNTQRSVSWLNARLFLSFPFEGR